MADFFLGIDAGTTLIKTVLFDERGRSVATAKMEHDIQLLPDGGAELDLELYWERIVACVRAMMKSTSVSSTDVRSLAASAHGVTVGFLDSAGRHIRRGFTYLDARGSEEAAELTAFLGKERIFEHMGQPRLLPMLILPKILWLKRHEPDSFRRIHKIVLVDDFLMYKLTGCWVSDPSLTGTTGFVRLQDGRLWEESLEYVGIQAEQLCPVRGSGTPVGKLQRNVAADLGLSEQTLVVCGTLDQAAGCLGSGNITEGTVTESTGTVLAVSATVQKPLIDPERPVPCFAHALPGKFIMLPWCLGGGRVLKWFRDELSGGVSYDEMTAAAAEVSAGSDGLLILPHLAGANSPEFNERARGVFFGIDFRHTRAHFARSIMESVGYMLRRNVELLRSLGLDIKTVCAIGGGARSRLWNQIKADILQVPVSICESEEVAALGAAILAAVGYGFFPTIEAGCRAFVRLSNTFQPNETSARTYEERYRKYRELYARLETMFT